LQRDIEDQFNEYRNQAQIQEQLTPDEILYGKDGIEKTMSQI